jgi:dTDP-3-amino-3,4,6-trideoxy-alpha-D-glucose transaminase
LPVPLFDTATPLAPLRERLHAAATGVIDSGHNILGPEVAAFERELAEYLGVRHAVGVANGTDAITLALMAMGVGPGDDVVVPSFTFYATAEAVVNVGGRPVFCDVDPDTFCITAETVERVLTRATRAVIPVHLFGTPAPMRELRSLARERELKLLEDAAQAAGARERGEHVGGLGDASAFSFFPSKNLFCLGDGGAIATNDAEVASRARLLRLHGSTDKQTYLAVGYNSRLDAIQAGVLREVLPHLDGWNAARRELASAYEQAGLGKLVTLPKAPPQTEPVHHMYVVRSSRREQLIEDLRRRGIESRPCYPVPVHRQPAMEPYARGVHLPVTDLLASDSFALPMGPKRGKELAVNVVDALHQSVNSP